MNYEEERCFYLPCYGFQVRNLINGVFCPTESYTDSINPATGQVIGQIPDSTVDDVNNAVEAAQIAFKSWKQTAVSIRSHILHKIADLIEANGEQLAYLESRDQGKPVRLAKRVDIPRSVHNFRFFADAILYQYERSTFLDQINALNYTSRQPVGVSGLISPWNLPLYLLTFKIAPCLAFGNTCVCKPSEFTSISAWRLAEICCEAGVPDGVINFIFGTGRAGEALVVHPDVRIISFTGSTKVGISVQEKAAQFHKKTSLELGGKNAAIVFADADLEKAVNSCIRAYKVGDPEMVDSEMGALNNAGHFAKVTSYIQAAFKEGAVIHCGYGVDTLDIPYNCRNGYFVAPTVITNVNDTSPCMQDEIFGPVTCVVPFLQEEEVLSRQLSFDQQFSEVQGEGDILTATWKKSETIAL